MTTPTPPSLHGLLVGHADRSPDKVALRFKRRGTWQVLTWRGYLDRVRALAAGLSGAGFRGGDRLVLCGEASPEWLIVDLAVAWLGGISVTPYPDGELTEIAAAADGARFAAVDTAEQLDQVRSCPDIFAMMLRADPTIAALSIDAVETRGRARAGGGQAGGDPDLSRQGAAQTIVFTPGAGGRCRPICLDHATLIRRALQFAVAIGRPDGIDAFCQVPFAHVAERVGTGIAHLATGGVLTFPERSHTVGVDLPEVDVSEFSALAWQWDLLASQVTARMTGAGPVARATLGAMLAGERPGLLAVGLRRALRRRLGIRKTLRLLCHGASPAPETERLMVALERPLTVLYGLSAAGGAVLVRSSDHGWSSLPGIAHSLAPDGELMIRERADEWPTGDLARLSGDRLDLSGDLRGLAGQEDLVRAEAALRQSPYVGHAVARQDGSCLTIVVSPNSVALGEWARSKGYRYTTFRSLVEHPEVSVFLRADVARVAIAVLGSAVPVEVRILAEPPTRRGGLLTASGTPRRHALLSVASSDPVPREEAALAISA